MVDPKIVFWLAETIESSSDESDCSWSDVGSETLSEEGFEDDEDGNDDKIFFPLMQYLIRRRRKRVDDYLYIVDSWSDSEFKSRMRISRKTAFRLIGEFKQILGAIFDYLNAYVSKILFEICFNNPNM